MADNDLSPNTDPVVQRSTATPVIEGGDPQAESAPSAVATRRGAGTKRPGDRVFEFLSTISATLITVLVAAVGLFLLRQAVPPLSRNDGGVLGFFTYGGQWSTSDLENMQFGIPNLFFSTVTISLIALVIAMPIALGIALFLSNYAPKSLVRPLGTLVDMLAAVPSIVFGLWGAQVLGPKLGKLYDWINLSLIHI